MRQLRLVGIADDHSHVVLATDEGLEHFALLPDPELDAALRTVARPVADVAPEAAAPAPGRELTVGPRDIQIRVRAGESPEEVAQFFGVDVERVMRFAAPVLDERIRIAEEARRARARRSRGDAGEGTLVVFGEAVDDRFAAHGIDPTTVTWSSRRREDGEWIVRADWLGGEGTHGAEWTFRRSSRSVTALDDTAADLLSDRPIRPVTPPVPERPTLVSAPPLLPGVVAFPPMAEALTGPLPPVETVVEHVYDQDAPPTGRSELGFLSDGNSGLGFEEPPLPLGITDPTTRPLSRLSSVRNLGRREESEDERAERVKVPSWDDILLGVRRKQD